MKALAASLSAFLVLTVGCHTSRQQSDTQSVTYEPVLSVDTERIINLARQAITDRVPKHDVEDLQFVEISYQYHADRGEHLRVGFRHSPEVNTETEDEGDRLLKRTVTAYSSITVEMDEEGNILSIDDRGMAKQISLRTTRKNNVQSGGRE